MTQNNTTNAAELSSRLLQEFTASLVDDVKTLASYSDKPATWQPSAVGLPYNTVSGHQFSGANLTKLALTTLRQGFDDNRWITFKQLEELQNKYPARDIQLRQGEHGTKVLRAEQLKFHVSDSNEWTLLSRTGDKDLNTPEPTGGKLVTRTLYYPYILFNASQIDGFPPKENPAPSLSPAERQQLVDNFVAVTGVAIQYRDHPSATYEKDIDVIQLPRTGITPQEHQALKLQQAYHALGHESRENRFQWEQRSEHAETVKAEIFSVAAAGTHGFAVPKESKLTQALEHILDPKEIFKLAAAAARSLSTFSQFADNQQPMAKWFPKKEQWQELTAAAQKTEPFPAKEQRENNTPSATPEPIKAFCEDHLHKARILMSLSASHSSTDKLVVPLAVYVAEEPFSRGKKSLHYEQTSETDFSHASRFYLGSAQTLSQAETLFSQAYDVMAMKERIPELFIKYKTGEEMKDQIFIQSVLKDPHASQQTLQAASEAAKKSHSRAKQHAKEVTAMFLSTHYKNDTEKLHTDLEKGYAPTKLANAWAAEQRADYEYIQLFQRCENPEHDARMERDLAQNEQRTSNSNQKTDLRSGDSFVVKESKHNNIEGEEKQFQVLLVTPQAPQGFLVGACESQDEAFRCVQSAQDNLATLYSKVDALSTPAPKTSRPRM